MGVDYFYVFRISKPKNDLQNIGTAYKISTEKVFSQSLY